MAVLNRLKEAEGSKQPAIASRSAKQVGGALLDDIPEGFSAPGMWEIPLSDRLPKVE